MSNRLNFSSLNDAWGISNNNANLDDNLIQESKFNYKKPTENVIPISSNEITELKEQIKELKENKQYNKQNKEHFESIKPCSLVNDHIKKCNICRNKLLKELTEKQYEGFNGGLNEGFNDNYRREHYEEEYEEQEEDQYNILETFENISPSQKNLLLIIIYGILIIVISDLVIKENK